MAKRKSLKGKRVRSKKNSRFLLFVMVGLVLGVVYYFNNNFSASTSSAAKISEVFGEIAVSPSSYKIQLVDETGTALKPEMIGKISVVSLISGKDCGPKGSTPTHPKGGCFSVDKPTETPVSVGADGTISFQSKLFNANQTFEFSDKKQKKYDYYFSGIGSGTNFVAWKTNTIIIRSADKKEEIAKLPINSNVYFQKNLEKAKADIANANTAIKVIKIPTDKITSVVGPSAGTPAAVAPAATVVVPTLSADAIASGSVLAKFVKSGQIIPGQAYQVYNWYYECTVIASKKTGCTKVRKYYGEKGVAGTDGIAKFKTELINIGSDYFIGEKIADNKFRIWSKSEVIAINADGKKIGSKMIESPFSQAKLNLWFTSLMDASKSDKNKQKMVDKYNKFFGKEYIIKVK